MEEKFTKGPWFTSYKERKDGMYSQAVYDADGKYVCECSWYPVNGETTMGGVTYKSTHTNREDNAHLIAQAPVMYEMLKQISEFKKMVDDGVNVHGGMSGMAGSIDMIDDLLAKARGES